MANMSQKNIQIKQSGKTRPCNCDGYWFPHRKGGGYCIFNPNLDKFIGENYANRTVLFTLNKRHSS